MLRQGHTADAVKALERAVELEPEDPQINGHLGDAYWAAGRRLEATYQWRRALTFNPEPADAAKLEAKLQSGHAAHQWSAASNAFVPDSLTEAAPAKVNLYLHVTGRRADGYHLLDSLVVFAGIGDVLEAAPSDTCRCASRDRSPRGWTANRTTSCCERRALGCRSRCARPRAARAGQEPAGRLGHWRRFGRRRSGLAAAQPAVATSA